MAAPTIRILIADDHVIVRKGIRALLKTEPGMEVIGEAGDGQEAVSLAQTLKPDLILMDLVMPRMDGRPAARRPRCMPCARDWLRWTMSRPGRPHRG